MEENRTGNSRVNDTEASEEIKKLDRRITELGDQISRISVDCLVLPRVEGPRVSSETPGGHWIPFYQDIKKRSTRDILISYQLARELELYWMDSFLGTALGIFLFRARRELDARRSSIPEQITAGPDGNSGC